MKTIVETRVLPLEAEGFLLHLRMEIRLEARPVHRDLANARSGLEARKRSRGSRRLKVAIEAREMLTLLDRRRPARHPAGRCRAAPSAQSLAQMRPFGAQWRLHHSWRRQQGVDETQCGLDRALVSTKSSNSSASRITPGVTIGCRLSGAPSAASSRAWVSQVRAG
ncbi:MAG: hypothetical protein U5R48_18165 [Gammaproteobacteria bacterium]|nr:hypothetical protein [Gammaproteobacteria bacterium]